MSALAEQLHGEVTLAEEGLASNIDWRKGAAAGDLGDQIKTNVLLERLREAAVAAEQTLAREAADEAAARPARRGAPPPRARRGVGGAPQRFGADPCRFLGSEIHEIVMAAPRVSPLDPLGGAGPAAASGGVKHGWTRPLTFL